LPLPQHGPGGTIPPSGKRQSTPSAWVFEFESDKIKESREYFDMMSFMQQIGAIPQP
jgi:predicted ester cyclase